MMGKFILYMQMYKSKNLPVYFIVKVQPSVNILCGVAYQVKDVLENQSKILINSLSNFSGCSV